MYVCVYMYTYIYVCVCVCVCHMLYTVSAFKPLLCTSIYKIGLRLCFPISTVCVLSVTVAIGYCCHWLLLFVYIMCLICRVVCTLNGVGKISSIEGFLS